MKWTHHVIAIFVGIAFTLPTVFLCRKIYYHSEFYGERMGVFRAVLQRLSEALSALYDAVFSIFLICLALFGILIIVASITSLLGMN